MESASKKRNAADEGVISAPASRVAVRLIHTDEDRMMVKPVRRVLGFDDGGEMHHEDEGS